MKKGFVVKDTTKPFFIYYKRACQAQCYHAFFYANLNFWFFAKFAYMVKKIILRQNSFFLYSFMLYYLLLPGY